MKISGADAILTLFLAVALLSACGGQGGNANAPATPAKINTEAAKTNIEELSLLVKVPYETEDIVWKDDSVNKRVIAVLRFAPSDADQIVADAQQFGASSNVTLAAESWFPGELIAQSEMSGDGKLNGIAYSSNNFYQEPYSTGKITRINDTNYFVLDVTAK